MCDFNVDINIGSGGFGTVIKAYDNKLKIPVAIKLSKNGFCPKEKNEHTGITAVEYDILTRIRHPNLSYAIKRLALNEISEACFGPTARLFTRGLVMPLAEGDLVAFSKFIHPIYACWQVICGVEALHDAGYLHLDIKPNNFLVYPNNRIVLSDFGLSCDASVNIAHVKVGSLGYIPPEILKEDKPPLGEWSDMYSLGCVLNYLTINVRYKAMSVYKEYDYAVSNTKFIHEMCKDWLNLYDLYKTSPNYDEHFTIQQELNELRTIMGNISLEGSMDMCLLIIKLTSLDHTQRGFAPEARKDLEKILKLDMKFYKVNYIAPNIANSPPLENFTLSREGYNIIKALCKLFRKAPARVFFSALHLAVYNKYYKQNDFFQCLACVSIASDIHLFRLDLYKIYNYFKNFIKDYTYDAFYDFQCKAKEDIELFSPISPWFNAPNIYDTTYDINRLRTFTHYSAIKNVYEETHGVFVPIHNKMIKIDLETIFDPEDTSLMDWILTPKYYRMDVDE